MSRILVAHHQSHALRLFSHLLTQRGVAVTGCSTGVEAERAVQDGVFDLLLLDRSLPDVDGLELLRTVRAHPNTARALIISLTAESAESDLASIVRAGADDFIILPMSLEMVQLRVDVLLRRVSQPPPAPRPELEAPSKPADTVTLAALPIPALTLRTDGAITGANKPLVRLTGYAIDELVGSAAGDVGLGAVQAGLIALASRGSAELETDDVGLVRRDGMPVRVDLHISYVQPGDRSNALVVFHRHKPATPEPSPEIAPTLKASGDLSMVFDRRGAIRIVSGALAEELGYQPDDLHGIDIRSLVHPDDAGHLKEIKPRPNGTTSAIGLRLARRDGTWAPLAITARDLSNAHGTQGFLFVGRKTGQDRDDRSADYLDRPGRDRLTGLPDRDAFLRDLHEAFVIASRERERIAVLYMNLDRFRAVNESFGYETGDRLLREVGRRLQEHLGIRGELARVGGDEFALLVMAVTDSRGVSRLAEAIVEDFRARPFIVEERELFIVPSIGIALSSPDIHTPKELLRNADAALVHARSAGHTRYAVFEPKMVARSGERLALEADLQRALTREELRVYYQPEVDLREGSIVGAEALVRWEHPRRGLILPGEFIETAELTGLIESMGLWVLEQACRQAAIWKGRYRLGDAFCIGVNFSADQFKRTGMINDVLGVLRRASLSPANLRVEITESALVDKEPAVMQTLLRMKKLGIRLAIDDFGTGYSSLSYLRMVPADTLKVDRSFVSGRSANSGLLSITESVATMAHSSGMEVVVEGIETAQQLERVKSFNCERGQGYYFSRPVAAETMDFLLSAGTYPFASRVHCDTAPVGITR